MRILGLALVAATLAGSVALAEETVVRERTTTGPGVGVQVGPVGVGVGVQEERRTTVTTGSSDCSSKTVTREDPAGSTTVKRTNCD